MPSIVDKQEVYRPSKAKWTIMLAICLALVVCGVLMVDYSDSSRDHFWGYADIAFFGLGVVIALINFIPGSSFLRLNPEGIVARSMWRDTSYRWSDIEQFGVARFVTPPAVRHRLIGMNFSASYPDREKGRKVKNFNLELMGFEGALPDNYGWDYDELAAHLNKLKNQYVNS